MSAVDGTHLILVDTDTDHRHSYAYVIDLKDDTAEYLFETTSMMEAVQTSGRYISWGENTSDCGTIAKLFDIENKVNYPLETHFIWLDNGRIAYRKYKMPIEEAIQYYTLEDEISCFSVNSINN